MKLSSVVALATGAQVLLVVHGDQTFASDTMRGDPLIPKAAKVLKTMAGMQFYPTGDCINGPFVTLTPSRFEEVTASGASVLQALDLNEHDSVDWSHWTPAKSNNVLISSSASFEAVVYKVDGDVSKTAKLKLTAMVYYKDATVSSAGPTLTVPKGALKFTAEITNWPFAADTNVLELGMTVSGQRDPLIEGVTPTDLSIPKIADKTGDVSTKIVTFDSGMFLDVPLGVAMDGANKKLSVNLPTGSSKIVWTFRKFATKAVYDPVLRYVEPVTVVPFDSAKGSDGKALIATAARFKAGMATIQFCLTGDCAIGPFVELMPSRFEEVTPAGDSVLQVLNLNEDDGVRWTDMVPVSHSGSLVSSSTSFQAVVYKVDGDASKTSKLKLTATVYYKNTTLTSAGQTFTMSAGALKFTAEITNWPFAANDNVLILEMQASGLRLPVDTETRSMTAPWIDAISGDAKSKVVTFNSGILRDVPLGVVSTASSRLWMLLLEAMPIA
ncbi:hypothetical protein Poli38472_005764 [Pythium oligandrum]|uniref:Uncharacterized protein n=1 Tax=Pythium oligandrum TaxID=41045 RepID=A0A8K1FMI9_PYTOL|nr:hypothetical protein Poli38472_005764 [Pythium oligandrum]|eukprot:TMW68296.1 hypothetical protein Poli38472_005764 [Pythium oligandrum]